MDTATQAPSRFPPRHNDAYPLLFETGSGSKCRRPAATASAGGWGEGGVGDGEGGLVAAGIASAATLDACPLLFEAADGDKCRRMGAKEVLGTTRVALWRSPSLSRRPSNAEQQLPSDATLAVSANLCLRVG
jgi:hypothetical protein